MQSNLSEIDRMLHCLAVYAGRLSNNKLILKGGTLLRVAAIPDFRYSEDWDCDWIGDQSSFYAFMNQILEEIRNDTGVSFNINLKHRRSSNFVIRWKSNGVKEKTKVEFVSIKDENRLPPVQKWSVFDRYKDVAFQSEIKGYTLASVASDKLSCLSGRNKGRDVYDIVFLFDYSNRILNLSWEQYLSDFELNRRIRAGACHPIMLSESLRRRKKLLAREWESDIQTGFIPGDAEFETYWKFLEEKLESVIATTKENMSNKHIEKIETYYRKNT